MFKIKYLRPLFLFVQAVILTSYLFLAQPKLVHAKGLPPNDVSRLQNTQQKNSTLTPDEINALQNPGAGELKGLTNPAISANLGGSPTAAASGSTFVTYFVYLWRVIIFVGGITVIIFYLQAAIDWVSSAGDKGKVEKAREKMTNATIGLIILIGSFLLISFIGSAIGYDLLNPILPKI
jgi:hypothetical protein